MLTTRLAEDKSIPTFLKKCGFFLVQQFTESCQIYNQGTHGYLFIVQVSLLPHVKLIYHACKTLMGSYGLILNRLKVRF